MSLAAQYNLFVNEALEVGAPAMPAIAGSFIALTEASAALRTGDFGEAASKAAVCMALGKVAYDGIIYAVDTYLIGQAS